MKTLAELEADLAKLQAEIEELKKPKGRYVPWYSPNNSYDRHYNELGLFVPPIEEYYLTKEELDALFPAKVA